jgi:hypothetical protein|eukprot:g8722.t1
MKYSVRLLVVSVPALLLLFAQKTTAQPNAGGTTCTNKAARWGNPSGGTCIRDMRSGNDYAYPGDFCGLTSYYEEHECPSSGVRVIFSNNIPDHNVRVGNPNPPCSIPFKITLPLNGEYKSTMTEPPALGILGIASNGVALYGAQEGGGTNAAEPEAGAQITDAQYWYGHAAMQGDWHYHSPNAGNKEMPSHLTKVGYAFDGFPIYGALPDSNLTSLDACNGRIDPVTNKYQYHVRTKEQVNAKGKEYCSGQNPAIQWNYMVGCFHGDPGKTKVESYLDSRSLPDDDCVAVKKVGNPDAVSSCQLSTLAIALIIAGAVVLVVCVAFAVKRIVARRQAAKPDPSKPAIAGQEKEAEMHSVSNEVELTQIDEV